MYRAAEGSKEQILKKTMPLVIHNISVAQFLHLCNGNDNGTYLMGLLWGLNEIMHVKCLGLYTAQGKLSISATYFII